jgi:PAS domain S-box-containing protein
MAQKTDRTATPEAVVGAREETASLQREIDRRIALEAELTTQLTTRSSKAAVSDALFRLLIESVGDYAIFMLDPTGRVATWNAGAQRFKGYAASEIVGRHFSVFYPEGDVLAGKCEMELERAARDGRFEDEGWRVRKDG